MGRSHCTTCDNQIAWYDNVPLFSFMWLKAKCRHCQSKISWQYPLVELGTGIVFALIGGLVFSLEDMTTVLPTIFYLGLFSMLIVIFVYDLLTMYIPMIVMWSALAWTALHLLAAQWLSVTSNQPYLGDFTGDSLVTHIASGLGVFIFFWALVRVSHETWMGMGDSYLALLVGLVVGFPGVLWAMTLSFGIGAVVGMILIASGKKGMKSQVPFAPFMVIGLALTILLPKLFPMLSYLMFF